MRFKEDWELTQEHFRAWWDRSRIRRPLMRVVARREQPLEALEKEEHHPTPEAGYLDMPGAVTRMRNYCRTHRFMAEAYPNLDVNLGPGSMAIYLGSTPVFSWDTVWYKECLEEASQMENLAFDSHNPWWLRHLAMVREAQALAKGEFLVNIPDIIENIDILSAMRGPQPFCFDLMDDPESVKKGCSIIDDMYFRYYDAFYDLIKSADGSSSYTAFNIWGPGKTAKVQCDISAMLSPDQFREFVLPSLTKQCESLDHALYHLDGPDAIRHLDALMEIPQLDALQWTAGAGQPDGGDQRWYPIYEKVRGANKSLWIQISDGTIEDWIRSADALVRTFGSDGLYLLFPEMEEGEAIRLMDHAESRWG